MNLSITLYFIRFLTKEEIRYFKLLFVMFESVWENNGLPFVFNLISLTFSQNDFKLFTIVIISIKLFLIDCYTKWININNLLMSLGGILSLINGIFR